MKNWRRQTSSRLWSALRTWCIVARKSPNSKPCAYFIPGKSMQASCFKRSNRAAIPMMQPADHWGRNHLVTVRRLNIACSWRVAIQRQVRAGVMIILKVVAQNSAKMSLIQNGDMIEALAADTSIWAFNVRILPWRSWCRYDFFDAHVLDAFPKVLAVDRVTITKQESRNLVERKRFGDLLSCPRSVGGGVKMPMLRRCLRATRRLRVEFRILKQIDHTTPIIPTAIACSNFGAMGSNDSTR